MGIVFKNSFIGELFRYFRIYGYDFKKIFCIYEYNFQKFLRIHRCYSYDLNSTNPFFGNSSDPPLGIDPLLLHRMGSL